MAWLGLDDTDTLEGGCTTYEFHQLLDRLEECSISGAPWGVPREPTLVRLWPFAPQRTRGNAALACRMDVIDEGALHHYLGEWFDELCKRIKTANFGNSAEPVLTFCRSTAPEFYWRAVREYVRQEQAYAVAKSLDGFHSWSDGKNDSGIIGALAAMCWLGEHDHTWELTAYRDQKLIGTERVLDPKSVHRMEENVVGTFMNRDPNSGDSIIAPRTPCPVLYGIRAENTDALERAHIFLQSHTGNEKAHSYQIWRTNQATGDHIKSQMRGVVLESPIETKGGHASIAVQAVGSTNGRYTLIAFKQGGQVNSLLRQMRRGDEICWFGLESPDGTTHLERLRILRSCASKNRRPRCICGGRLSSAGAGQALRCDNCRSLNPRLWINSREDLETHWVEPEAKQRRHLAKPLSRMTVAHTDKSLMESVER